MDTRDWIFIVLCILLVGMMAWYVYQAETYKLNYASMCIENAKRICSCYGG